MKTIFLLLLLPMLCRAGFLDDLFPDVNVELLPKNPQMCTTQNFSMICNVKDLSLYNASDINITLHGTNNIQSSEIKVINESAASKTLWDLKPNDAATVCCNKKGETQTEGSCQILRIYDYPVPVADLKCIVYDWSENMNCSWSHGTNYKIIPTSTFEWRVPHRSCGWRACPDMNRDFNYCFWNSTHGKDFSLKVIDVRVNVAAKCGAQTTDYFTINTKPHVKPAPMTNFRVASINSTCARVTWNSTRREFTKIYEVWHTSRWNNSRPSQIQTFDSNTTGKVKENEAIFCGLVPATAYTFFGRVKPGYEYWSYPDNIHTACGKCSCTDTKDKDCQCLSNSGYWSDETKQPFTTYGDIPSASPAVSAGGYSWDPRECESNGGFEQYRSVSIYWKPLDELHKNGEIRSFLVKITCNNNDDVYQTANDVASDSNYYNENLRCDSDCTVNIWPKNANGTSKEASTLHILASRKGVYPPTVKVEMSNTTDLNNSRTVTVQGEPARSDATGFTVFSCKKEDGRCALKSLFDWKSVGPDVRSTDLQIELPEDYLYGVSMETNIGSSGMTWQSCIYTKDVEPKRAPSDVKVETQDKQLLVIFQMLPCLSGEPIISHYIVEYCLNEKCNTEETRDNSITLNDLEGEQQYGIRVKGVTPTGMSSPWSEMVQGTPTDSSLKPEAIVGICLGALTVLIVVIAGVICIARRCFGCCKKVAAKKNVLMVPISNNNKNEIIPEEEEDSEAEIKGKETPPYMKQYSDDSQESGFGEGSPNSMRTSAFFNEEEERKKEQLRQHLQERNTGDDYVTATEFPEISRVIYPQPAPQNVDLDVFRVMQGETPDLSNMPTNLTLRNLMGNGHADTDNADGFLEHTAIPITEPSSSSINQVTTPVDYVRATQSDSSGNGELRLARSGDHSTSMLQDYTQLHYEDEEGQTGPLIGAHSETTDSRDVSDIVGSINTEGATNEGFESEGMAIPDYVSGLHSNERNAVELNSPYTDLTQLATLDGGNQPALEDKQASDYVFAELSYPEQSSPDKQCQNIPPIDDYSSVEHTDSNSNSIEPEANMDDMNQEYQDAVFGLNTSESVFNNAELMISLGDGQTHDGSQQLESTEPRNGDSSGDGYVSEQTANQLLNHLVDHSDRASAEENKQTTPDKTSNSQNQEPVYNGGSSGDGYISEQTANQILGHLEDHSDRVSAEEQITHNMTSSNQTPEPAYNGVSSGDGYVSEQTANQMLGHQGEIHSDCLSAEDIGQTTPNLTSSNQTQMPDCNGDTSRNGYVSEQTANQMLGHQGEDHSDRVCAEDIEQTTPNLTSSNQTREPVCNGYLPHSAVEEDTFNQGHINQRTGPTHSSRTIPADSSQAIGYVPHHFIEDGQNRHEESYL